MTVYIDEVFMVNLIMDWLVLWTTARMLSVAGNWRRLGSAAIFGAVYSILFFFPGFVWLAAMPGKIICSLFMVWIGFGFSCWQNYLKCIVYLYFVSFVLGGASIAAMYLFGQQFIQTWNGIALVQIDFQLFWLVIAALMVLGAGFLLRQQLRRDISAMPAILKAQIFLGDRNITISLLVDTGNCLVDPLSARPVIVAEQNAMLSLFPENFCQLLQQTVGGAELLLLSAQQTELAGRLRLIPYRAVGQQGLLLGIRPDTIILQYGAKQIQHTNIIVALSNQKFSPYGTYQGLVQPELL